MDVEPRPVSNLSCDSFQFRSRRQCDLAFENQLSIGWRGRTVSCAVVESSDCHGSSKRKLVKTKGRRAAIQPRAEGGGMKRNCQPKKAGPLTAAVCLAALGVGVFASVAHTFVKTGSEPWIAPARAARKQNPIPTDAKSVAQGKELFAIGCLPWHGRPGLG